MSHLEQTATAMIEHLDANGFNGVWFDDCYMQKQRLDDWISDGKTEAEYQEFIQNNASFILQPDLMMDHAQLDNRYQYVEVDSDRFHADLQDEIYKWLGDDINIKHWPSCSEFEVSRDED